MALCNPDRGVNLDLPGTNPARGRVKDLNQGPLNFNSSVLNSRSRRLSWEVVKVCPITGRFLFSSVNTIQELFGRF